MRTRSTPGPLLLAVVLFIALCTTLLVAATASCDGRLTYALDDPYVQLATAHNLSAHGVWGVTQHAFTSAAPSPLWTATLAVATLLTGPRPGWPLVLDLLAGLAVIAIAERAVRRLAPRAGRGATLAILIAVVVFAPLAPLAFTGQEHLLLAALALAFALAVARACEEPEDAALVDETRPEALLAGLAVPLTATSGEGFWLVAAAAALLYARGRRRLAWTALLAGLAPLVGYALVALSQGWFVLPTPLLLDARPGDDSWHLPGLYALERLLAAPHLLVLVVAALALVGRRAPNAAPDHARAALILFLGATGLHLQLGRIGWFERHASHLVVLGLVAVGARLSARSLTDFGSSTSLELSGAAAGASRARRTRRTTLVLVMLVPLLHRGLRAAYEIPRATRDVYERQVQVGLLLAQSYRGATVAVCEPGVVSWLADAQVFDLTGLATADVARLRFSGAWNRDSLEALAREHGVRIAVVHESWFAPAGGLPASWERVGSWRIPAKVLHGDDTISFFAAQPGERPELERALDEYRPRLPRSVIVTSAPPARRM